MPESSHSSDDQTIGRVLSRREILARLGGIGAALVIGTSFTDILNEATSEAPDPVHAPTTIGSAVIGVVEPQAINGPFRIERALQRSDITDGRHKEGVLLHLGIKLFDVSSGMGYPLEGAQIEMWHADPNGLEGNLHGAQLTDAEGAALFTTLYPGWTAGRAVHLHFRIRTHPTHTFGYEMQSQFFFDETVTTKIYSQPPYRARGLSDVTNDDDSVFQASGGLLTLLPAPDNRHGGYTAMIEIGLLLGEA